MTPRFTRVVLMTSLLVVGAQTAAVAERFTERFEQTYAVEPGVEIRLDNTNGSVTIEIWDENRVEILAEKRVRSGSAADAEEALEEVEIVVTESDGRLEIETEHPSGLSNAFSWIFGGSSSVSVSYELRVPGTADLEVRTVNGNVSTVGSRGRQRLRSTNGRIEVDDAHRGVDARTTNGSIAVGLLSTGEAPEVELGTTNGSITLQLPDNVQGHLEARTVNGAVRTEVPITIRGTASKRRVDAEINGGGSGRISLRTINGSIRIVESTV